MVCNLSVRDVGAERSGHVALSAIGLLLVVLRCECIAVTDQTFSSKVGYTFCFGRRCMRIVTAGARHRVAAFYFTLAARQRFHLRDRSKALLFRASQHVMPDVVGEQISGMKIIGMLAGPLDSYFAFEVTFHANRVPARRR